jgi:polysaccharide pyruvyl transferase WcaK-like protein
MIGTAKSILSYAPRGESLSSLFGSEKERASARAPDIALFGLFGCGNFGNDGSLEAILNLLRRVRPDARLTCICANPDLIRDRFDVSALPISAAHVADAHGRRAGGRARKIVEKLHDVLSTIRYARKFDLVLIPGTGILDDFGDRPKGMPWNILRWCLAARLLGAKVAFVCIGAGPIGHPLSRWMMKTAARLAHYRSYRDVLSKDFMTSIGVKSADPVFADLAFALPPPLHRERPDAERLVVGVGVMSYYGWYSFAEAGAETHRQYIDKLGRFVRHILDRGHRVRLIIGETADDGAVKTLLSHLRSQSPAIPQEDLVAAPANSLHDVMCQMQETDVIVATRYHNIVCALKLAKPTISLGYSKKNDVLMGQAGLGAYCHHVERFEVDQLIEQFETICAQHTQCADAVRAYRQIAHIQLAEQEAMLRTTFL